MDVNSRLTRRKTTHASLKSITMDMDPELVFYIAAFLLVQDTHNMCIFHQNNKQLQTQVFTTMGTAAKSFPKGSILLSGMCVLVKIEYFEMPKFSLCML